jgi:hypothetical protein
VNAPVVRIEIPFEIFTRLRDRAEGEQMPVNLLLTRLLTVIPRTEARRLGLHRYFTGQPCKRGHIAERNVGDWVCVECRRLKGLAWRATHREQMRADGRAHYAALKVRVLRGESRTRRSVAPPASHDPYIL